LTTPAFLAVVDGKICWDIEADTSLEFVVNAVEKIAVLVKELEKTS
jgi:hypothetical protein